MWPLYRQSDTSGTFYKYTLPCISIKYVYQGVLKGNLFSAGNWFKDIECDLIKVKAFR